MTATKDLIGAALDWAVAKCEGTEITFSNGLQAAPLGMPSGQWEMYSTNWAQGGPIVERENISVGYQGHFGVPLDSLWYATNRGDACDFGQTPLIAAMRCYVASKLGPVVEVPDELAQ